MIDVKIIKKPKASGGTGGSSGGSSGGGTVSKAAKADKAKTAEQADYATRAGVATRALYCDNAAGISAATATVDDMTGKPSVTVSITDWDEVEQDPGEEGMTGRTLDFAFSGLKGEKGEKGDQGPEGPQGPQGDPGDGADMEALAKLLDGKADVGHTHQAKDIVTDSSHQFVTELEKNRIPIPVSLNSCGYVKIASIYIQWGKISIESGSTWVYFPTSFPTACQAVTCSTIRNRAGEMGYNHVCNVTTVGFDAIIDGKEGYYIAIGY